MDMSAPDPVAAARARENFPVASRLIAPALRPVVMAFYRVARGTDDIADDPLLDPATKMARLQSIDGVLAGTSAVVGDHLSEDAATLRETCRRHGVDIVHARHLIAAFLADARNQPCRSWEDLIAYCRLSAAPVGRFLLELHGEARSAVPASDALCTALQILNHLQDCQGDWRRLQRCYVPLDWLAREGLAPEAFLAPRSTEALRRVIDRVLDATEPLIAEARQLPACLHDSGLAAESAAVVAIADSLAASLRRHDPLAGRVAPGRARKVAIIARAAFAHARWPTRSSFALSIRLFDRDARRSVAAVYALARRLDDIVDGPADPDAKAAAMSAWHEEIARLYEGRPQEALTSALGHATASLPRAEFDALIEGLAMDAGAPIHAPDATTFRRYCRGVAGAIGVLVLAACGHRSDADRDFAVQLGEAFQTVNVLRDIDEDAARGRLYVPAETLRAAGLDPTSPIGTLLADPRFAEARRLLAADAASAFAAAQALAREAPGSRVFAVRLMTATYRRILERLAREPGRRPRLGWRDHGAALATAWRGAT
jgi:squalene synthase HpnC